MALEKTKLVVEIEANTKKTSQEILAVTKSVEVFGNTAKKSSVDATTAIEDLELKYSNLAKIVQQTTTVTYANQSIIEQQSSSYALASKEIDGYTSSLKEVTNFLASLSQILSFITDEKKLQRLSQIFRILSSVASIKGNDQLEETFLKVSKNAELASDTIHRIKETAPPDLEEVADNIGMVATAFEYMKGAAFAAGSVVASMTVFAGINKTLEKVGKGFSLFESNTELFASSYGRLQSVIGVVTGFDAVRTQLEGMASGVTRAGDVLAELTGRVNSTDKVFKTLAIIFRGTSLRLADLSVKLETATGVSANFFRAFIQGSPIAVSVFDYLVSKLSVLPEALMKGAETAIFFSVAFEKMAANGQLVNTTLNYIGKGIATFGNILSGVSTDLNNIPKIFAAITTNTVPMLGKLGAALALTTGLAGGFAALGFAMMKSDNTMAKIAGGSLVALAVSIGGILVALKALSTAIGDFVTKAGFALFTLFDKGLPAAIEDEKITAKFASTITRLSGSVAAASPILAQWNSFIEEAGASANFTESDLQTLTMTVAKMGQEFKISAKQQQIIARDILAFSKNSEDAAEVSDAVRAALNGQTKQVEALGINLNDLAVSQSKYVKGLGKSVSELSEQEKVQARLILLHEQAALAATVMGESSATLAQMQHKVVVIQDELSGQMAQSMIPLYKILTGIQLGFLEAVKSLPQGLKDGINSFATYSGAILIVLGLVTKWGVAIAGIIGLIGTLNAFLKASAAAQALLGTAFGITNTAMGVQTVAITGLNSVLVNLALLLKGSVIALFKVLWGSLVTLTKATWAFTSALLSNPLFWKSAAIITAIVVVSKALLELGSDLKNTLSIFKSSGGIVEDTSKKLPILATVIDNIVKSFSNLFTAVTAFVKLIMTGAVIAVFYLAKAFVYLEAGFNRIIGKASNFDESIQNVNKAIEEAKFLGSSYADTMVNAFENTARAAENASHAIEGAASGLDIFQRAAANIDVGNLKIGVFGTEYEQAIAKATSSLNEYNLLQDRIRNGAENIEDAEKQLTEAREKSIVAFLELSKKQRDIVKNLGDQAKESRIQQLKDSGKLVEAAKMEGAEKLSSFEKQVKGFMLLKQHTGESIAGINSYRKALMEANKMAVDKAGLEEAAKLAEKAAKEQEKHNKILEERKKFFDAQFNATSTVLDLEKQLNDIALKRESTIGGQQYAIELQAKMDILKLANQRKQLELAGALTAELDGQITAIQEAVRASALLSKQELEPLTLEVVFKGAEDLYKKAQEGFKKFDLKKSFEGAKNFFSDIDLSGLGTKFLEVAKNFGAWVKNGIMKIDLKAFGKGLLTGLQMFADTIIAVFNPANISALADTIEKSITAFPQALAEAFGKLDQVLIKFINAFPAAFDKILQALPGLVQVIIDKIPAIINMLADALVKVFEILPRIMQQVFDRLPLILDTFMKALPNIIKALLVALPQIVNGFVAAVPAMIAAFLDGLPKIVEQLVAGLVGATAEIAIGFVETMLVKGGLEKIIVALLQAIPRVAFALVKGLYEGLKRTFDALFRGIKLPKIGVDSAQITTSMRNATKALSRTLSGEGSKLFAVMDLAAAGKKGDKGPAQAIQDGLAAAAAKVTESGGFLTRLWEGLLAGLKAAWMWVYNNVVMPIFNGLKAVWLFVYNGIILPVIEAFKAVWEGLRQVWLVVKANIVDPLIGGIKEAFGWVKDNVVDPLINGIKTTFAALLDKAKEIGKAISQPIVDAFAGLKTAFTSLFDGMKKLFKLDFSGFATSLKEAFSTALGALIKPWAAMFNGMIDMLNGLKLPEVKIDEKILGKAVKFTLIPGTDLIPDTIDNIPGYAKGGLIGEDNMLARVSEGEFVVRRAAVQALGTDTMASINKGVLPQAESNNTSVTVNLDIKTTEPIDENYVRNRLIPRIKEELRRASLDGAFILSGAGVRS